MSDLISRETRRLSRKLPTARRRRLIPASLGVDFGSSTSKQALCWLKREISIDEDGEEVEEIRPRLLRISLHGDLNNPERNNRADNHQYEFPAYAAVTAASDEVITGRKALAEDLSFPLKTVFLWLADIRDEEMLERLPGGPELIQLLEQDDLDSRRLKQAVTDHFELLHKVAIEEAAQAGVSITTIVVTFPHYLTEKKNEIDPDKKYYDLTKYLDYYLGIMRTVWEDHPVDIQWEVAGEGQAAAFYICSSSADGDGLHRDRIWEAFDDLRERDGRFTSRWLTLAVIDCGSSGMGIHSQAVYFDEEGEMDSQQSLSKQEWLPGTTGGSNLTNEMVKEVVLADLEMQPSQAGDRAELIAQWELGKHDIDFLHMEETLVLHTKDDRCRCYVFPKTGQEIFYHAFGQGLELVETQITNLIMRGQNFGVVLCGGSYLNKGLRRAVQERLDELVATADSYCVRMKYLFLASIDNLPTSAVACGAAMAPMHVPALSRVLSGSALGLQARNRVDMSEIAPGHEHVTQWDENNHADFLFSKGCGSPPYIDYKIRGPLAHSLQFSLVCDPNHYNADRPRIRTVKDVRALKGASATSVIKGLPPASGTTVTFRRLSIGEPPIAFNGPHETYDLNFRVDAADLPGPLVRFRAIGAALNELVSQEVWNEREKLTFELLCTKLDPSGHEEVGHMMNKRWQLTIRPDPVSKLATTTTCIEIPKQCAGCQKSAALIDEMSICRTCKLTGYCAECYELNREEHSTQHKFHTIILEQDA